jgi:hypothetical protein
MEANTILKDMTQNVAHAVALTAKPSFCRLSPLVGYRCQIIMDATTNGRTIWHAKIALILRDMLMMLTTMDQRGYIMGKHPKRASD